LLRLDYSEVAAFVLKAIAGEYRSLSLFNDKASNDEGWNVPAE
jgi:hypothetical protein